MNREERLKFCKTCKLQKHDEDKGIICGLTNQVAMFDVACTMYREDPALKQEQVDISEQNTITWFDASKGKRFFNNLIDGYCAYLLMTQFAPIMGITMTIGNQALLEHATVDQLFTECLFIIFSNVFYFVLLEATTGRTVGKMLTRTRVVDLQGHKPELKTILIRTLCRFVPLDSLSFLFEDNGWHDRWSKTRVVED